MTIGMWIVVLVAWCVISVPVGMVVGSILRKRNLPVTQSAPTQVSR